MKIHDTSSSDPEATPRRPIEATVGHNRQERSYSRVADLANREIDPAAQPLYDDSCVLAREEGAPAFQRQLQAVRGTHQEAGIEKRATSMGQYNTC